MATREPPKTQSALRQGNGVVGLGDSIVAGSGQGGVANKFFDFACILSDQRLPFLANLGIGGQTAQQVMARVATDVVPLRPSHCVVCCFTNNFGNSDIAPAIIAYAAGVQRLRNSGIEPVLCVPPPRSGMNAAGKLCQSRVNWWLRDYAVKHGLILIDLWTPLADQSTGGYASGMGNPSESPNYVHPSVAGTARMAQALVDGLAPLMPVGSAYLGAFWSSSSDVNLVYDGDFSTDTNSDGVPDNWFGSSSGGSVAFSLVADNDEAFNWYRMDVSSAPSSASMSRGVPTPWVVGDELELTFRMRTANVVSGSGGFYCRFDWGGAGTTTSGLSMFPHDIDDHIVRFRATIPTGTTACSIRWGWQAGTFQLDIARVTVVNRTQQLAGIP